MTQRIGQLVDVSAVREQARIDWEREQAKHLSIQERVGVSVPWWLIIIAATLFTLSVPHTMAVFNQITPTFGKVAPFGIEFGLLYYAFRAKLDNDRQQHTPWHLHLLGVLMFSMAIIVNGAGSLQAVVEASEDTRDLPISQLVDEFSSLPATSQVALLLVPAAALFIPLGTFAAGEGLAKLFLEHDQQNDVLFERWQRVQSEVEFQALRDAALSAGATATQANKWAQVISGLPGVSTVRIGQTDGEADALSDSSQQERGHGYGQGYTRTPDARSLVLRHLDENPEDVHLSVRNLADVVGVRKTTAHTARSEWAASRNGHEHEVAKS